MNELDMKQTGRYRFRRGWFGPVLQAEYIGEEEFEWKDVSRSSQVPKRVFCILRPSEWLAYQNASERVGQYERRAEMARNARAKKKSTVVDFEASRMP